MERESERELAGALSPVNHIGLYQGRERDRERDRQTETETDRGRD